MTTLKAQPRDVSRSKNAALRKEGMILAVMYGPKEKATPLAVSGKDFTKAFKEAGESTVITLEMPGGKKSVLIHDVQFDPVKSTPIHTDLYAIEAGKDVEVSVPLGFVGVAPAVKELGGILVKVLHELEVKGKPDKLPHSIEVDISALVNLDSHIAAGDIALPDGVALITHAGDIVASIAVAKEEVEEAAPVDLSAIEVEQKGKKEEEAQGEAEEEKK